MNKSGILRRLFMFLLAVSLAVVLPAVALAETPGGEPAQIAGEMEGAGQTGDETAGMPAEEPVEIPIGEPLEQPSGQPSEQPEEMPAEQPSGQPMELPSEQPVASPAEAPNTLPKETPLPTQAPVDLQAQVSLSVTNGADSGLGSLRDTIAAASANDTITFDAGVTNVALSSPILIDKALVIDGSSGVTITVASGFRHFSLGNADENDPGFDVSMRNLTLLGPGIGNGTPGFENGGIFAGGKGATQLGPYDQAPYFNGTLMLENCTLRGNVNRDTTAAIGIASGGGINLLSQSSTLVMKECAIEGNAAIMAGGGLCAVGTVEATDCVFDGNLVQNMGGAVFTFGIQADGCTFSGNTALMASGGAVTTGDQLNSGMAALTDCTFTGNRASQSGGGLAAVNAVTAVNCTFTDNEAQDGGAVFADTLTMASCTVTGNTGLIGSGVNAGTSADIAACIIVGNTPLSKADQAVAGGAPYNDPGTGGVSGRFNIIGTDTFSLADLFGSNVLADNGGETKTIMLTAYSPALDAIPVSAYQSLLAQVPIGDQRGKPRPDASDTGVVDIGALEAQQAVSIAIVSPPARLDVGQAYTLAYTTVPAAPEAFGATWNSSNSDVLAIDPQTGALAPKATGNAVITVTTANGKTASSAIQVVQPVTAIRINEGPATLAVSGTVTYTATVSPAGYSTTKPVTWNSSNPGVAAIGANGVVTAVSAGAADITASIVDEYNNDAVVISAPVRVTVAAKAIPVTGVTLNVKDATVAVGNTVQLTVTISPGNATDQKLSWGSGDASIATVNTNGLVKGVKAGTVKVRVTTHDGGYTATCTVTVTAPASPTASPTSATTSSSATSPQTGDDSTLAMYIALCAMSGGILMITLLQANRKRR